MISGYEANPPDPTNTGDPGMWSGIDPLWVLAIIGIVLLVSFMAEQTAKRHQCEEEICREIAEKGRPRGWSVAEFGAWLDRCANRR